MSGKVILKRMQQKIRGNEGRRRLRGRKKRSLDWRSHVRETRGRRHTDVEREEPWRHQGPENDVLGGSEGQSWDACHGQRL